MDTYNLREFMLNSVLDKGTIEGLVDLFEDAFVEIRELLKLKDTHTFADIDKALEIAEEMTRRLY